MEAQSTTKNFDDAVQELQTTLLDTTLPISKRFRCIFTLRNLKTIGAIEALALGLHDKSALLKHEIAFCLGQMEDPHAIPILIGVLRNKEENSMVRHEAAEALGAIAQPDSIDVLREYQNDPVIEVAETCQIAIDRIQWVQENKKRSKSLPAKLFDSVDPAPAFEDSIPTEQLKSIFLNTSLSLFERYRAMFSLRDRGDTESVLALAEGLSDKSALFRHEIAYVMGQLQHPAAVKSLSKTLNNNSENPMVRHEAAEAIGSIATEDSLPLLSGYLQDKADVVRESCLVALDIQEYNNSEQFQYADGLNGTKITNE